MTDATAARSYRPGQWFGIFGEHALVLLPPSEKGRVGTLWALVDDGAGFDVVLDALISEGLRDLPGFVLVSTVEGETKVVIRGEARAWFTTGADTVEVAGTDVTTWAERSFSDVSATRLVVGAEGEQADGAPAADRQRAGPGQRGGRAGCLSAGPGAGSPGDEPRHPGPRAGARARAGAAEPEPEPEPQEPRSPSPSPSRSRHRSSRRTSRRRARSDPSRSRRGPRRRPRRSVSRPVRPRRSSTTATPGPARWLPTPPPTRRRRSAPRPVARLVFSSGDDVEVDRAVLVGRAPEARRFTSGDQPRLVTVPSPAQEISSTHLEIRPGSGADHGGAVVTDLGSTNGTVLVQPGLPPEDLQAGIAVQLIPGAIIDLGDGVTIQVINP